jgi:hypothetical protein
MQIGQILVEQNWVAPDALARALAEQRHTGKRICSLLIARGLLDPDNAARALANQHNVPGVLQKHLENRDPSLASLLPAALARACFALPIGRTRTHELIICVRDPRPELRSILASAVGGPVVIAVCAGHQLEPLLKQTYEGRPTFVRKNAVSFEVDMSTRQIAIVRDPLPAAPLPATLSPAADLDEVEVDLHTRQIAVVGAGGLAGLGDLGSMTLVELDDARVTKDLTQSGPPLGLSRTTTTPFPSPGRPTSGPYPQPRAAHAPPPARATTGPSPQARTTTSPYPAPRTGATNALSMLTPNLDATIAALDRAAQLEDATELAMRYLAARFRHAVLFTVNEGAALGDRGHGGQLTAEVIHAITIPLSAPSIVQVAHDTRRLATEAPTDAGAIQERLTRTLGHPKTFAALPVEVDAQVAYVIAVGDPTGDVSNADYDLERLGRVLGAAYQRLPR